MLTKPGPGRCFNWFCGSRSGNVYLEGTRNYGGATVLSLWRGLHRVVGGIVRCGGGAEAHLCEPGVEAGLSGRSGLGLGEGVLSLSELGQRR